MEVGLPHLRHLFSSPLLFSPVLLRPFWSPLHTHALLNKLSHVVGVLLADPQDGALIPGGREHRHTAKILTDTLTAIFVEDV
jgi:hypothetical protein